MVLPNYQRLCGRRAGLRNGSASDIVGKHCLEWSCVLFSFEGSVVRRSRYPCIAGTLHWVQNRKVCVS